MQIVTIISQSSCPTVPEQIKVEKRALELPYLALGKKKKLASRQESTCIRRPDKNRPIRFPDRNWTNGPSGRHGVVLQPEG